MSGRHRVDTTPLVPRLALPPLVDLVGVWAYHGAAGAIAFLLALAILGRIE